MLASEHYPLRVDLNNRREVEEALHFLISLVAELRDELSSALEEHELFNSEEFSWVWDDDGESDISAQHPELDPEEIADVRSLFDSYQEALERAGRALMRVSAIPV